MLYKKMSLHGLAAGGIILGAIVLRLILVEMGWPLTNSDEGTMGIMALHIAYQGQHPLFFYGQNYMGSWEAFLASGIFLLSGPSLVALRLGTLLMFALFLISLYLLTRLLFPRNWALVTLLLVGPTSAYAMAQELRALGGYAETLLFGTLLFLAASWLALTNQQDFSTRRYNWRWLVYLSWGLVAGLGLWDDLLILPMICTSGLLILLICRREWFRPLPLLCLILGLLCGAEPLIYYNLHAAPGMSSLDVLEVLRGHANLIYAPTALFHELTSTVQLSLPMMTGEPFCPVSELTFIGPNSPATLSCGLAHDIWSGGYLLLLGLAGALAGYGTWLHWRKGKELPNEPLFQQETKIQLARFLLLLSAFFSLLLYTFSIAPLSGAGLHARYLICLLTSTPAVFWPLWQGLQSWHKHANFARRSLQSLCVFCLLCYCALGLVGSILTFGQVPAAAVMNQSDAGLIHELATLGVKSIYSGYWTCGKIVFESDEHVVCAVLNAQLQIDHLAEHNRDVSYVAAVEADQRAAYVFPTDPEQFPGPAYIGLINPRLPVSALPAPFAANFTRIFITNYVIYQPRQTMAVFQQRPRTVGIDLYLSASNRPWCERWQARSLDANPCSPSRKRGKHSGTPRVSALMDSSSYFLVGEERKAPGRWPVMFLTWRLKWLAES